MTSYWLVKSEPDAFSWTQQVERGIEPWTGVRSHQARRNLEAMSVGDRAFFYHSNTGREIVGIVEVTRASYSDPTGQSNAMPGGWICVDMRAVAAFSRAVSLAELKRDRGFATFALLRQPRLSVVPVSEEHWHKILSLGGVEPGR